MVFMTQWVLCACVVPVIFYEVPLVRHRAKCWQQILVLYSLVMAFRSGGKFQFFPGWHTFPFEKACLNKKFMIKLVPMLVRSVTY